MPMVDNVFVKLDKAIHDRTKFDCGEEELNSFFKTRAAKHQSENISLTLVMASDNNENGKYPVRAFYTVSPCTISRESLPKSEAKKLPIYPIPVFLFAQLAVDSGNHGRGLGKITLINSLEYLYKASKTMPAYAVVVDCLNDNAEQFYRKYGFDYLCEISGRKRLFIPMGTIAQLFSDGQV